VDLGIWPDAGEMSGNDNFLVEMLGLEEADVKMLQL
jgi:hypothetical protein